MNPERWRQIERIYHLALDRPPHEREVFLDSECHGDQRLRLEVDLLLRRTPSAESFLTEPAIASRRTQSATPHRRSSRSWIRREGNGRVFYEALGHSETIYYNNPAMLEHILAGMQYVLGDLQADDSLSVKPSKNTIH